MENIDSTNIDIGHWDELLDDDLKEISETDQQKENSTDKIKDQSVNKEKNNDDDVITDDDLESKDIPDYDKIFGEFESDDTKEKNKEKEKEENSESESESESEKLEKKEKNKSLNSSLIEQLKEEKILPIEDDLEISEENIKNIISEKIDQRVSSEIEDLMQNLPEDLKVLNKFVLNGGSLQDYIAVSNERSEINIDNINIESEKDQSKLIRQMLKEADYDDELIETQLNALKESEKIGEYSKKYLEKLKVREENKKNELLKEQEEKNRNFKEYQNDIKKTILEKNYISDSIDVLNFMTKAKWESNGSQITEMQKSLLYDIPQNKEAFIQLAMILKSRNEDGTFNLENLKFNSNEKKKKKKERNFEDYI